MSIYRIFFGLCYVEIHSFCFSALRMVVKIDKTVFMNCFFYIRLQKKFIFVFCFLACIWKRNYKQRKLLYLYIFFVSCYLRNFIEKLIKEYIEMHLELTFFWLFFIADITIIVRIRNYPTPKWKRNKPFVGAGICHHFVTHIYIHYLYLK